jgi:hypothetical protein
MNQRGDCTLFGILILLALSSLLTLTSLSLIKSFKRLKQRTNLILCLKEFKGEQNQFIQFISKTNFALKNISRAKLIAAIIPGLQLGSMKAETLKRVIQRSQDLRLISYLNKIADLKRQSCPVPMKFRQSPFDFNLKGLKRNYEGTVIIRNQQWKHYFQQHPYVISMSCQIRKIDEIAPKISCHFWENVVTLYSPSF